jgi:hypothetical protein
MTEYDFLILSPSEFECLSRDLLQKKLSVFIESFTSGRDNGIDLRYTTAKGMAAIIQAKRYKDYNSLVANLKKETVKVKQLQPHRYIITTTVGLTPNQKSEIFTLFSPYILTTEDILGKDDLNNLLAQNKEIEQQYYKLWLSSTNILRQILLAKTYNQTSSFFNEIKDTVKIYVQNDSFSKALDILKNNKYVIISGIPGIGKTTLSKMLVYHLLSNDFNEFVYLSDSIDEGYSCFEEAKNQVFFFDDFLGRNSFEAKNNKNADDKIVKFIEIIKRTPRKALIIATREYILKQAMGYFEKFQTNNIEIAKCILDLSSYTKLIKAQILYNHLVFQNIPQEHLQNLVDEDNYLKLINHKNYNPRIIETIINHKIWTECEPMQFTKAIKTYFDNPGSVWLYAFQNSLDRFSQYTLLVLLTMGTPVFTEDLELALKEFLHINNYKLLMGYDSMKFHQSLKELEDTFIKIEKDLRENYIIEYKNPSIQDFLANYLKKEIDLIEDLLRSAIFTNQFFKIFSAMEDPPFVLQRIVLAPKQIDIAVKRIIEIYDNLSCNRIYKYKIEGKELYYWQRSSLYKYSFLNNIRKEYMKRNSDAEKFIYEKMQDFISSIDNNYLGEKYELLDIMSNIELNGITMCDEKKILSCFCKSSYYIDDIKLFKKFEDIFPFSYKSFMTSDTSISKINSIIKDEIQKVENPKITTLIKEIKLIEESMGFSFEDEKENLQKRNDAYQAYLDSQADNDIDHHDSTKGREYSEDELIKEIFTSLIE